MASRSALDSWSPEQITMARRWVQIWREAGPRLDAIRRHELRELDTLAAIRLLSGPTEYYEGPRAPKPTSGLIEQQRLFARWRRSDSAL